MRTMLPVLCCVGSFALGMAVDGLITRVPEEAHTVGEMSILEREARKYRAKNGDWPKTIDELRRFSPGVDRCMTNPWGAPILYSVENVSGNVSRVTLTTMGYGGDIEITRRFTSVAADQ